MECVQAGDSMGSVPFFPAQVARLRPTDTAWSPREKCPQQPQQAHEEHAWANTLAKQGNIAWPCMRECVFSGRSVPVWLEHNIVLDAYTCDLYFQIQHSIRDSFFYPLGMAPGTLQSLLPSVAKPVDKRLGRFRCTMRAEMCDLVGGWGGGIGRYHAEIVALKGGPHNICICDVWLGTRSRSLGLCLSCDAFHCHIHGRSSPHKSGIGRPERHAANLPFTDGAKSTSEFDCQTAERKATRSVAQAWSCRAQWAVEHQLNMICAYSGHGLFGCSLSGFPDVCAKCGSMLWDPSMCCRPNGRMTMLWQILVRLLHFDFCNAACGLSGGALGSWCDWLWLSPPASELKRKLAARSIQVGQLVSHVCPYNVGVGWCSACPAGRLRDIGGGSMIVDIVHVQCLCLPFQGRQLASTKTRYEASAGQHTHQSSVRRRRSRNSERRGTSGSRFPGAAAALVLGHALRRAGPCRDAFDVDWHPCGCGALGGGVSWHPGLPAPTGYVWNISCPLFIDADLVLTLVGVSRRLASPLHGRRPDIVAHFRHNRLAINPNLAVRSRSDQLGTCNIGVPAEIGAGSAHVRPDPRLEHPLAERIQDHHAFGASGSDETTTIVE